MKIRITSVADEDATTAVREPINAIANSLNLNFVDHFYGAVNQFTVVVVAVDSDPYENDRFCTAHNKFGTLKNPFTAEKIKYLSIALAFDPVLLCKWSESEIRKEICSAILLRLRNFEMRIPKGFDFEKFVSDIDTPLEILIRASF